ncbi:MAG: preprotein translocase subunit SecG [Candidatus Kerfeldbacteria bacterium]|nr:preprotein translocase subunit SecG [Candidatus Kerfeldbacteria bacterium]
MPHWVRSSIPIVEIVLSVILVALILLQSKGSGLSNVFGGEGNIYSTKRGAEKVVFIATIITAALFFGIALINATL